MRFFIFLLAAPLVVLGAKNKGPDGNARLCPDGYLFAGDDTKPEDLPAFPGDPRDIWYEEAGRSPEYSCYRMVEESKTMLEAMHACQDEDAELFTPEDKLELARVNEIFQKLGEPRALAQDFFTSGLYMHDFKAWKWIGSEKNFRKDLTIQNDNHEETTGGVAGSVVNDCLMVRFNSKSSPDLSAIGCNYAGAYVCEARVVTVTYYTWFVANWIDLLLGFLLVILFVSLCVSVCSFGGNRSNGSQPRRPIGTRRPRTTDPNQMNGRPIGADLPPSYDTSVRVHKPPLEPQTPVKTISGQATGAGRIDAMRMRGKELFAKVYYYKDGPEAQAKH